ncbi:RNA polymerase sigma factor [Cohnella terricola]|uniref:RNA polymerase sigma factor n=1 Tax=Cohnella terricola TaxID=1289167 RepID=A0A559JMS8_9BACL|nr:RNA polymerase sigma factor [Cohnella terricola]TVY01170.1 RNA polymerase sigma factor [Cohnella terricola]
MAHDYLKYVSSIQSASLHDLMQEHGQEVWNYAYLLTKNSHVSDDIAQEVFLQAFLHISSFRGQSSVRTWLFSIARNAAFNYKKSAFIRKVTLLDFLYPVASLPSAEEQYLNRAYTDSIWELVMKLPPKFREVLILDACYEMPLAEIALLLRLSIGTVKSRLHRARAKMKTYLKEVENREGS